MTKTHYVECECSDANHILRITYDLDFKEVLTEVQLNPYHNFFQRVWLSVKYMFGYSNKFGHWDCAVWQSNKVDELIDLLVKFKVEAGLLDLSGAKKIRKALATVTTNPIYEDVSPNAKK